MPPPSRTTEQQFVAGQVVPPLHAQAVIIVPLQLIERDKHDLGPVQFPAQVRVQVVPDLVALVPLQAGPPTWAARTGTITNPLASRTQEIA
jgi:hypothetical protein